MFTKLPIELLIAMVANFVITNGLITPRLLSFFGITKDFLNIYISLLFLLSRALVAVLIWLCERRLGECVTSLSLDERQREADRRADVRVHARMSVRACVRAKANFSHTRIPVTQTT